MRFETKVFNKKSDFCYWSFLLLIWTKLRMASLKANTGKELTFCTRVLDELNWAKIASTAKLTELTRAVRHKHKKNSIVLQLWIKAIHQSDNKKGMWYFTSLFLQARRRKPFSFHWGPCVISHPGRVFLLRASEWEATNSCGDWG